MFLHRPPSTNSFGGISSLEININKISDFSGYAGECMEYMAFLPQLAQAVGFGRERWGVYTGI